MHRANEDKTVGWIMLRVPIVQVYEASSFESPGETYLTGGAARLVGFNLPDDYLEWLSQDADLLIENFEMPIERLQALGEGASVRLHGPQKDFDLSDFVEVFGVPRSVLEGPK